MSELDPQRVIARVIEIMGGHGAAFEKLEREHAEVARVWDQDTEIVGRILRAHLFVEHFLTEYLAARAPSLDIKQAGLPFSRKLAMLGTGEPGVSYLIPGLRLVNEIRNRIAHRLRADVSENDAKRLLSIEIFRALRSESDRRRGVPSSTEPADVVERFCQHAGRALQACSSSERSAWSLAIEEVTRSPNSRVDG